MRRPQLPLPKLIFGKQSPRVAGSSLRRCVGLDPLHCFPPLSLAVIPILLSLLKLLFKRLRNRCPASSMLDHPLLAMSAFLTFSFAGPTLLLARLSAASCVRFAGPLSKHRDCFCAERDEAKQKWNSRFAQNYPESVLERAKGIDHKPFAALSSTTFEPHRTEKLCFENYTS